MQYTGNRHPKPTPRFLNSTLLPFVFWGLLIKTKYEEKGLLRNLDTLSNLQVCKNQPADPRLSLRFLLCSIG